MTITKKDLTFKHNQNLGRHGWLRLTPAYSVKIVEQILDEHPEFNYVLDPFSGTGTTGLVCAERGLKCDLLDINPYLVWFAKTKTRNYSKTSLNVAEDAIYQLATELRINYRNDDLWLPPISNIERWWEEDQLLFLANLHQKIFHVLPQQAEIQDLVLIAFSRLVIELSNAAFNHQSMSFNKSYSQAQTTIEVEQWIHLFIEISLMVINSARKKLTGSVKVMQTDSRVIPAPDNYYYDSVITSPPYPNRMSYIRELRPYMYWLRYLTEARQAGELDWLAIGGTWGIATSRVSEWENTTTPIKYPKFQSIIQEIANDSQLLSRYVHKYFVDVAAHLTSLFPTLRGGAKTFYIVGNSKFYNTLVPVETIYAHLLEEVGFVDVNVKAIRKRNSKKELFEFCVSATKP